MKKLIASSSGTNVVQAVSAAEIAIAVAKISFLFMVLLLDCKYSYSMDLAKI
jgi:hypothetical protein